ncbi:MAG: tetratricopeptide repeat protein [Bacteroidia bacterium]|nr:tetratricopeptide repeat protein [Bacteroidia bacterium]
MSKQKKAEITSPNPIIPPKWAPWAWLAGILILTFVTMSPVVDNDWTNWDDEVYVVQNTQIQEFNGETIGHLFNPETRTLANYDPVSMTTLAWDLRGNSRPDGKGGQIIKAKPFHQTSLLFHLANTMLVFLFLYQFFDRKLLFPIVGALLFGVHPMHVEAVAWVSARKEVVYTFFFLFSLLAYDRHLKKANWLMLGLTFLAFVLSALSKPSAVALPGVLLAMDLYKGRTLGAKSLLEKVPFFAVSVWIGLLTIAGQAAENALQSTENFGLGLRFLYGCYGLVMYVVKAIIPFGMAAIHPYPNPEELSVIFYLAPVLALGMLVGLFFLWKKGQKGLWFGGIFYLITIALVLQFITFGHTLISERFTYLPYVGLFIMLAFGLEWALQKWNSNKNLKWGLYGLVGCLGIAFVPLSQNQAKVWKNSKTLMDQSIAQYPDLNALPYNNRGLWFKQNNQYGPALQDFNQAIDIDPGKALYFNNRGNLYRELAAEGQNEAANLQLSVADLSKAIEINPNDPDAYNSRGLSYLDMGNEKAALADFTQSIEIKPENDLAYLNRAVLQLNSQALEPALADFDQYVQRNPNDIQILNLRGYTRFRLGQFENALTDQNRVIHASPDNGSFYMFRAFTLDTLGRAQDALSDARRARELGAQVEEDFMQKLEGKVGGE